MCLVEQTIQLWCILIHMHPTLLYSHSSQKPSVEGCRLRIPRAHTNPCRPSTGVLYSHAWARFCHPAREECQICEHTGICAASSAPSIYSQCRLIWKYETSKEARIVSYIDRIYTCRDCGQEFVFTAGEQEFYSQKGFLNDPVRCPDCRRARKKARQESGPRKRDAHAPDRHREH